MKTIFHIEECKKWDINIERVKNVLSHQSNLNKFQTILIVNGKAVNRLKETEAIRFGIYDDLKTINKQVKINVCKKTLEDEHIDTNELCSFVDVVSSSYNEITNKQNDGFAYIKS